MDQTEGTHNPSPQGERERRRGAGKRAILEKMEGGEGAVVTEKLEEDEERTKLLRDRFRLSVISIVEAEAKKQGMEIAGHVVPCIAELAFELTEQLAKDVELFAQHAGRKSVNMEDVILSAHRNETLLGLLRSFSHELKAKEPQQTQKKRKRSSNNEVS
ncbi:hypothetical protein AXF42_Ash011859 [Apostasia shenzhenica]|uniref:Centromere protein S n=1 Tax=Apostasia shenzhenica TaxID=1088818 RepID=A0A2I0AW11_9ASPA|nr:hypothetical protein AXF42_Ash011859 [Apostasia shenzhenica]